MSLFQAPTSPFLPLRERGTFEKQPDWVQLWEYWAERGSAALFESGGPVSEASRWVILAGNPEKEVGGRESRQVPGTSAGSSPVHSSFFDFAEKAAQIISPLSTMPFCLSSAWFGLLSYEFGESFVLRPRSFPAKPGGSIPSNYFFKPRSVMAFDRITKEWYGFGESLFELPQGFLSKKESFQVGTIESHSNLGQYSAMVEKAQTYIGQGDIYQANLAQAFRAQWKGQPGSLYRVLREINPAPFMGIFKGPGFTVVSSSPERLAAGQGDWLETRPIAGTRPRGKDSLEDLQMQWELQTNPKEQAEHLMLVDLARNDLGRVSRYGTVEVKSFAEVESYARVHHLVSVVQGRRRSTASMGDILRSLFPGGTITGCPKIRSMEIIAELENWPRGFYTGSMGFMAPGPCFDFNILIRSFTLIDDGELEFCAGAGIVADSHPEKEYLETLHKVEALARALGASLLPKP